MQTLRNEMKKRNESALRRLRCTRCRVGAVASKDFKSPPWLPSSCFQPHFAEAIFSSGSLFVGRSVAGNSLCSRGADCVVLYPRVSTNSDFETMTVARATKSDNTLAGRIFSTREHLCLFLDALKSFRNFDGRSFSAF